MSDSTGFILIVDDEPDMCWALEHILSKSGYVTHKALTGQEALHLMQAHHFRSVFLDAKLQDMDGLELARSLRLQDPDIKIIMVSGYFFRDDLSIQKALSQGLIHGFISKPFLQEEILLAIQR
ncbi:MAG: response regulator [Syntrophobacterales bacterium]|jgi:CheY-like chemotaxis protein|nr:response regulator [Syntrophobacterales bacterium]